MTRNEWKMWHRLARINGPALNWSYTFPLVAYHKGGAGVPPEGGVASMLNAAGYARRKGDLSLAKDFIAEARQDRLGT